MCFVVGWSVSGYFKKIWVLSPKNSRNNQYGCGPNQIYTLGVVVEVLS